MLNHFRVLTNLGASVSLCMTSANPPLPLQTLTTANPPLPLQTFFCLCKPWSQQTLLCVTSNTSTTYHDLLCMTSCKPPLCDLEMDVVVYCVRSIAEMIGWVVYFVGKYGVITGFHGDILFLFIPCFHFFVHCIIFIFISFLFILYFVFILFFLLYNLVLFFVFLYFIFYIFLFCFIILLFIYFCFVFILFYLVYILHFIFY